MLIKDRWRSQMAFIFETVTVLIGQNGTVVDKCNGLQFYFFLIFSFCFFTV